VDISAPSQIPWQSTLDGLVVRANLLPTKYQTSLATARSTFCNSLSTYPTILTKMHAAPSSSRATLNVFLRFFTIVAEELIFESLLFLLWCGQQGLTSWIWTVAYDTLASLRTYIQRPFKTMPVEEKQSWLKLVKSSLMLCFGAGSRDLPSSEISYKGEPDVLQLWIATRWFNLLSIVYRDIWVMRLFRWFRPPLLELTYRYRCKSRRTVQYSIQDNTPKH
jgi:hypothetical protein